MTLYTERLILKGLGLADMEAYKRHFVDYEVIRFLSARVPWPYPDQGIEDFFREVVLPQQGKNRWFWGIYLKDQPTELIGCVDLWRAGRPENRGFWLGRKFWGKGIMTEATVAVIDYAFASLGFDKLIFSNALGNIASRKVKEKTGCQFIGTRLDKFVDPALDTVELWELHKDNWEKHKAST